MNTTKSLTVLAAAFTMSLIGTGISAGAAARAETAIDPAPRVLVRYADLNLATTDGVARLYRRIVAAAQQVCPAAPSRELRRAAVAEQCRVAVVSRAVQQVNDVHLSAIHQATNPRG